MNSGAAWQRQAHKHDGGTSHDQLVFDTRPTSANKDRIYDFRVVDDTIRLGNAIFTKVGVNGYLKAGAFWTNNTAKAHDKDDRVIYDKDSGVLYYDSDGTRSAQAAAFATVTKNIRITANDFDVV